MTSSAAPLGAPVELSRGLHLVRGRRHGFLFLTDLTNDRNIDGALLRHGAFDEAEAAVFELLVFPGDVVLEVASNSGPFTPLLSKLVGPSGLVHAVEPNPRAHHLLHAQLALNRVTNVAVHPLAIGRTEGWVRWHRARVGMSGVRRAVHAAEGRPLLLNGTNCTSTASTASCIRDGGRTFEHYVRVTTVDGLLHGERCNLLKLDVEGSELDVLIGAANVLNHSNAPAPRPLVYTEEHASRPSRSRVVALLASLDYRVLLHTFCTDDTARAFTYREKNLLALPAATPKETAATTSTISRLARSPPAGDWSEFDRHSGRFRAMAAWDMLRAAGGAIGGATPAGIRVIS